MAFELFREGAIKEECREMFRALKDADFAISDLPYDNIKAYAEYFGVNVKLRRLKQGRVKVALDGRK